MTFLRLLQDGLIDRTRVYFIFHSAILG